MLLTRQKKKALNEVRFLAKWFQVEISIRLFGKLVWSYKWPPDNTDLDDVIEANETY